MATQKHQKGINLELKVARLLYSQGLTPFLNIWFRSGFDFSSVQQPDVDVMGCRFLPDATIFFAHYDCKSGESKVVNRVLLLSGLKDHIPPGPIIYIRKQTTLDIKRYAIQYGIKITDISQIAEKESKFVSPVFGDNYPSICDIEIHNLWNSTKGKNKKSKLGRILGYFDYEFWREAPFTRLKRSFAAVQLIINSCNGIGMHADETNVILALAIRRFLFSVISAASHVSLFSKNEIEAVVKESLVTEKLSPSEYHSLIESTAQFIFDLYGDASKGPLREEDYYVPPPDYTEELINILQRTIDLQHALPYAVIVFDALVLEGTLRNRKIVMDAIIRLVPKENISIIINWLRSLKLLLSKNEKALEAWIGWRALNG